MVALAVPLVAASALSPREAAVLAVADTLAVPLLAASALSPPRGTAGVTVLQPHVVLDPSHAIA